MDTSRIKFLESDIPGKIQARDLLLGKDNEKAPVIEFLMAWREGEENHVLGKC